MFSLLRSSSSPQTPQKVGDQYRDARAWSTTSVPSTTSVVDAPLLTNFRLRFENVPSTKKRGDNTPV